MACVRARAIKLAKDLNRRILERLAIEQIYWQRRGIDWKLVTEKELTSESDQVCGLPSGASLTVVKHLLITHRGRVDMRRRIDPAKPLLLIATDAFSSGSC